MDLTVDRDRTNSVPDLQISLEDQYIKSWKRSYPRSGVRKTSSVQGALELVKKIVTQENNTDVLITESLHVVGEALRILAC